MKKQKKQELDRKQFEKGLLDMRVEKRKLKRMMSTNDAANNDFRSNRLAEKAAGLLNSPKRND